MDRSGRKRATSRAARNKKNIKTEEVEEYRHISYRHKNDFGLNSVTTSKYTLKTFFPLSLWAQFSRLANVYFLIIAILQSIPEISPLPPITAIAPLLFVITLSMCRDAYEDYSRHQSDKKMNEGHTVEVLQEAGGRSDSGFSRVKWRDLRCGDIVRIHKDESFPADLLLLSSSLHQGICYVDTMNLDGETNPKIKRPHSQTQVYTDADVNELVLFHSTYDLAMAPPNGNIYNIDGTLSFIHIDDMITLPVDNNNILLRGTQLKNTNWVFALVAYVGNDTKEILNVNKKRTIKMSSLEKQMNKLIIWIFIFQLLCCSILFFIGTWAFNDEGNDHKYFLCGFEDVVQGPDCSINPWWINFLQFFSYIVLLNTLIPSSLIVTIEIVKMVHASFIDWDNEMSHNGEHAKARTKTLCEEIGQINHLFTDKTGTMTENIMTLRKFAVNGKIYTVGAYKKGEFSKEALSKKAKEKNSKERHLLTMMAITNTVIVEKTETGTDYFGESQDELSIVSGVSDIGFTLSGRKGQIALLDVNGMTEHYNIIETLEFTSERKCMSIIVQKEGSTDVMVFTKGADEVVIKKCVALSKEQARTLKTQLDVFTSDGLRVLCYAYKRIEPKHFSRWIKRWRELSSITSLKDRKKNKTELLDEMESNLSFHGVSAVEDALQKGVKETVIRLRKAGIKIWMLTGDKVETAIEIGHSSGLITSEMFVHQLTGDVDSRVQATLGLIVRTASKKKLVAIPQILIVDGSAFNFVVKKDADGKMIQGSAALAFYRVVNICDGIILARSSPMQKSLMIELLKSFSTNSLTSCITMAVGDGANDVAMIKQADVGVGIVGLEGSQAVMNSDISCWRFQDLDRLLLFHGRLSYYRMSNLILYFFYKNIVFTMPQFIYAFYCFYSGQTIYDAIYITLYNVFFTALPVFSFSIQDQDVHIDRAKYVPEIYQSGQRNFYFSNTKILWFVFEAFIHSCFLLFFIYSLSWDAKAPQGLWTLSAASFIGMVVTVTFKLFFMTRYWTGLTIICYTISLFGFMSILLFFDDFSGTMQGVIDRLTGIDSFWLLILLSISATFFTHLFKRAAELGFVPDELIDPIDVVRNIPMSDLIRRGRAKKTDEGQRRRGSTSSYDISALDVALLEATEKQVEKKEEIYEEKKNDNDDKGLEMI